MSDFIRYVWLCLTLFGMFCYVHERAKTWVLYFQLCSQIINVHVECVRRFWAPSRTPSVFLNGLLINLPMQTMPCVRSSMAIIFQRRKDNVATTFLHMQQRTRGRPQPHHNTPCNSIAGKDLPAPQEGTELCRTCQEENGGAPVNAIAIC